MKCSACGADIEEDAKFCTKCGASVIKHEEIAGGESSSSTEGETKKPPEETAKKAESKVGEMKEEGPKEVTTEKSEEGKETEPVDRTAEKIEKATVEPKKEETVQKTTPSQVSTPEKEKKSHTGAIAAVLVILLFIIISAIGYYFLYYLPSQSIYSDKFQEFDTSTWSIMEKGQNFMVKVQDGSLVIRNGAIYLNGNLGSDYTIECGINIVGVGDKNGSGGVIFRGGPAGMYVLKVSPDTDLITLTKQPGNDIINKNLIIEKGKWYLVAIKVEGENIGCFLNKKQIIGVRDVGFAKGGCGLRADNATVLFQDFVVK
jgi:hypothetical protein